MKADITKQQVEVTYDPAKTGPEKLAEAISKNTEYRASVKST